MNNYFTYISKFIRHLLAATILLIPLVCFWAVLRGDVILPTYIDLGIFQIHFYSLALLAAFLACIAYAEKLKRQDPQLENINVWEGLVFVLIPAIVGARLYHVITDFQLYQNNLPGMFAIWNGGLGIIGGIIGGVLGLFFFARARKLSLTAMLGAMAVILPIGQAVGRLGNLFNHELYGPPTDLPWGQFIPVNFRKSGYESSAYFHPLFLYEALASLILAFILRQLWLRGWRGMKLVSVYLAGYGIIRFCLDFLRIDGNTGVSGLSYTQWLIIGGFVVAVLMYLFKSIRKWQS